MAEFLTGQQRHHLWFLKVAIALASVSDGSNLPRPDKLETKPRMAPELWICAKLEIASSNVTSSGGETRLMWKSAGDDEPGPIVAALASLQVLQGCRSRGRVWTGTTKLPRQGLRPRNNLVLDSERSDPVIHRHESPRQTVQSRQSPSQQRSRPREHLAHHQRQFDQPDHEKGTSSPSSAWRCPRPCSLITDRCELHSRFRGVHASSCVSFRALRRRMNLKSASILTPKIHPGDLLWGSCRLRQ